MVPIAQLRRGPPVRLLGEDHAHARLLAGTPQVLPPILVQRSTMTVVDGAHRVLAARLRGQTTIEVRFFEGGEAESFVAAVQANIEHGKPLNLADRQQAAEKIMVWHPGWSDRVIGQMCALSPRTVASIRHRATDQSAHLPTRTGRDGRTRPVDPQPGRKRIATAMLADPLASTRRIARQTGTAAGTVRDVRRRSAESSGLLREDGESCPPKVSEVPADAASRACWAGDTACVSTEAGDRFARWIDATDITNEDCERYVDGPPLSRLYEIVAEANDRAARWAEFAAALENRARQEGSARPPE